MAAEVSSDGTSNGMIATAQTTPQPQSGRPPGSLRYDWFMLAISFWPLAGAFADANAHANLPKLETIFTPWHAILYSGVLAVAICNLVVMRRNHALGYAWSKSVPAGYEMTLIGIGILVVAGIGDLTWHFFFGIEKNIAAVVSPTHLLIAVSLSIILAGPLRSAMSRTEPLRGAAQLPLLLSVTFMFTLISILTQFLNPLANLWPAYGDVDLYAPQPYPPVDPFITQSLGLASIAFFTALLMGIVLFVVRRWSLFPGALTIFLGFSMTVISGIAGEPNLILLGVVIGIIGDILLLVLRPSASSSPIPFRLFALILPFALYWVYFLDLYFTVGLAWSVHLWVGAIFAASIIGWLLSYLVLPPVGE